MIPIYTEEEFTKLEEDERFLTEEAILVMLAFLAATKNSLEKELRNFYQLYGKDGVVTYQEARKWVGDDDHRRRLTALFAVIKDNFDILHSKLNPKFDSFLSQVAEKETDFFGVDIDREDVLNTPWGVDKETWYERLEEDIALWAAYVAVDIKQSLVKRAHVEAVVEQLGKRFDSIESVLRTLGISESTAVGSLARQRIFKELGITKYQFFTRPDERRCEHCGSMHGMIFPITAYEVGVTASPIHPRCRCWEVPIME